MSLQQIEKQTQALATCRAKLAEMVQALTEALEEMRRNEMPSIRRQIERASQAEAEVRALVEANPGLFARPRTQVFHGIQVGFRKGAGKIEWDDDAFVVARIRKHFPDDVAALIRTVESPNKEALERLEAKTLAKLGVTVTGTGDIVVCRPVESALDKAVKALLKASLDERS